MQTPQRKTLGGSCLEDIGALQVADRSSASLDSKLRPNVFHGLFLLTTTILSSSGFQLLCAGPVYCNISFLALLSLELPLYLYLFLSGEIY